MIENEVLRAIRERRSILRFRSDPVDDGKINAILEAGRWAPSSGNSQPWEFIVVKDADKRQRISDLAGRITVARKGIEGAPAVIVTCVDPEKDSSHFVEDGAVATQNMALAAHSLGLASYWVGIYDRENMKGSVEEAVKEVLSIPKEYRVIAFLPIGQPLYNMQKDRKKLTEITHHDKFGNKPEA